MEVFCDNVFQTCYIIWESVNVNGYEKKFAELAKSYKAVKIAIDIDSSSSVNERAFIPEKLPERRRLVQLRRNDLGKTQNSVSATMVADMLRIAWLVCKGIDTRSEYLFRTSSAASSLVTSVTLL